MVPLLIFALLAQVPTSSDSVPASSTVYLDSLLADPNTAFDGNARFRAMKRVQFGSQNFSHALVSEAHMHRTAEARFSAVAFSLGKRFKTFEATLGRDNAEQELGRSYCYFEVYADGKRIYISPAMRSALSSFVAEGNYAVKVGRPQEIRLDVENVETLKLVIQMADFGQRGDRVDRAAGCTFAEARVTLKPGVAPPEKIQSDSVLAPTQRAIRQALEALLRRLPEPTGEPVKLALAPFRLDDGAMGSSATWWIYLSEQLDRQTVQRATIQLLEGSAQAEFSRLLPIRKGAAAAREDIVRAARNVGADWFLDARLTEGEKGWQVEMEVRDTTDGALLGRSLVKVVRPSGNL